MADRNREPKVFADTVTLAGGVVYVAINAGGGARMAIQVAWTDDVAEFAVELQTTLYDREEAPHDQDETTSGNEHRWHTEPNVIPGAPSGAPGSSMSSLSNFGPRRARLKITPAADSPIEILLSRRD